MQQPPAEGQILALGVFADADLLICQLLRVQCHLEVLIILHREIRGRRRGGQVGKDGRDVGCSAEQVELDVRLQSKERENVNGSDCASEGCRV